MRLLNTRTLKLEEFFGRKVPHYAILSHTWGEEEVTLGDMKASEAEHMAGWSKLRECCARAALDDYEYVWIDTCCIDKTSSAELSEAINSMYKWYKRAKVCYAYLADVPDLEAALASNGSKPKEGSLESSRWFKRGWTLQELIAPPVVEFYTSDWTEIGTKSSLREKISSITGIDIHVLDGLDPSITCTVAGIMSWAASRQTTRVEDAAYSLLGIFKVCMPLLYGEGEGAFIRLQEEILRTTDDFSLLAQNACYFGSISLNLEDLEKDKLERKDLVDTVPFPGPPGPLSANLGSFRVQEESAWSYSALRKDYKTEAILRNKTLNSISLDNPPSLTARGLRITLPIYRVLDMGYLAYLYCTNGRGPSHLLRSRLCISLKRLSYHPPRFEMMSIYGRTHHFLPVDAVYDFSLTPMIIRQNSDAPTPKLDNFSIPQKMLKYSYDFQIDEIPNSEKWEIHGVYGNWACHSTSLPWQSRITPDVRSRTNRHDNLISTFEAVIVFHKSSSRADLPPALVKFGINGNEKLWCRIVLDRTDRFLSGAGLENLRKGDWELDRRYVPNIPVDRASVSHASTFRVLASIRELGGENIVVKVRIQ